MIMLTLSEISANLTDQLFRSKRTVSLIIWNRKMTLQLYNKFHRLSNREVSVKGIKLLSER
jgi:hypothetical protein